MQNFHFYFLSFFFFPSLPFSLSLSRSLPLYRPVSIAFTVFINKYTALSPRFMINFFLKTTLSYSIYHYRYHYHQYHRLFSKSIFLTITTNIYTYISSSCRNKVSLLHPDHAPQLLLFT